MLRREAFKKHSENTWELERQDSRRQHLPSVVEHECEFALVVALRVCVGQGKERSWDVQEACANVRPRDMALHSLPCEPSSVQRVAV